MIDFIRGVLFVTVSCLCAYGCWHTTEIAEKNRPTIFNGPEYHSLYIRTSCEDPLNG